MQPIQLMPNLLLSDISGVSEYDTSDVDVVVSVCQDCRRDNVDAEYLHFPLADDMRSKRSHGGSVDYQTFYEAAQTVAKRMQDETVLVHCHLGRNRSVSVCAAVLAATQDDVPNSRVAFGYVDWKRDYDTDPSPLMRGMARQFEIDASL